MGINLSTHMPKEGNFTDSETISSTNKPEGKLTVVRVDEVEVKTGPRAGQKAVVIDVADSKGKAWTYWPNKTSIGILAKLFGDNTDEWMNKEIELESIKQMVRGEKRDVLYVKE